jgi:hypothetical protein
MAESISAKIEKILATAKKPLSLDEICLLAFGQLTERNRSATRTNLYRLDEAGLLVRHPRTYALKMIAASPGGKP